MALSPFSTGLRVEPVDLYAIDNFLALCIELIAFWVNIIAPGSKKILALVQGCEGALIATHIGR